MIEIQRWVIKPSYVNDTVTFNLQNNTEVAAFSDASNDEINLQTASVSMILKGDTQLLITEIATLSARQQLAESQQRSEVANNHQTS